ncbi:MAG TPA: glycosyltransferase [Alphaproteobacteria bacterium]|nr:glycosyltransferase [Alphaproteobacteria bacterium]
MSSKSVVFFLPTLAGGGAERDTLTLAGHFAAKGHKVTLLLQRREGELLKAIPKTIRTVSLDQPRTLLAVFPLTAFLQQEKPDVLISSFGHNNIIAILARMISGLQTRIIVCQHTSLSIESKFHTNWQYLFLPFLSRIFLPRAQGIVAVSQSVANDLSKTAKLPINRVTIIYNPVVTADFEERMNEDISHPWFGSGIPVVLGVGRLVEEKDFATLIQAFAVVAQKYEVRLAIVGDGPLRQSLIDLTKKLGVNDLVMFLGYQTNPLPFIRRAAVLAASSKHEGFGNALVEALACGTPVVSTKVGGAEEILKQGSYGQLVPIGNPGELTKAIAATLSNPLPKDFLKRRGMEFTAERAGELYARLCGLE